MDTPGAVLLLTTDGRLSPLGMAGSTAGDLAVIRAALNCRNPEPWELADGLAVWFDTESDDYRPESPAATALCQTFTWPDDQPVYGPVVLTGGTDTDGRNLPLTAVNHRLLRCFIDGATSDAR